MYGGGPMAMRGPHPPSRPPPSHYRSRDEDTIIIDLPAQKPRPQNPILEGFQARELLSHKKRVHLVAWNCEGRCLASGTQPKNL